MDSPQSLEFVNDFSTRIQAAQSDPSQERSIREFVAGVAMDCPLNIIVALANCVLDLRRAELLSSSRQN